MFQIATNPSSASPLPLQHSRGFTPVLAQFYNDLKAAGDANAIEIIFVTSDQDQGSFDGYYGEQPWTAIPYGDGTIEALGKRFGVRGIPAFQICDPATGKVIDADGRGTVMAGKADPKSTAASKWSP
jgi:nucleoredoxin